LTAELARTLLLIGLATCAAFVVMLSFFPWVDFAPEPDPNIQPVQGEETIFSLNGTQLSRIRGAMTIDETAEQESNACSCRSDLGDGYIVAIFGVVAFVGACLALYIRSGARSLVLAATLAVIGAFTIAGYNAIAVWEGVGRSFDTDHLMNLDGSVRTELYVLTATAGLAAILGGAVLATTTRAVPVDDESDWDDETSELEEQGGWA
jgi:hypothetical protein